MSAIDWRHGPPSPPHMACWAMSKLPEHVCELLDCQQKVINMNNSLSVWAISQNAQRGRQSASILIGTHCQTSRVVRTRTCTIRVWYYQRTHTIGLWAVQPNQLNNHSSRLTVFQSAKNQAARVARQFLILTLSRKSQKDYHHHTGQAWWLAWLAERRKKVCLVHDYLKLQVSLSCPLSSIVWSVSDSPKGDDHSVALAIAQTTTEAAVAATTSTQQSSIKWKLTADRQLAALLTIESSTKPYGIYQIEFDTRAWACAPWFSVAHLMITIVRGWSSSSLPAFNLVTAGQLFTQGEARRWLTC